MFDRKGLIQENKRYYYSNEYLRQIFDSYNSQRELKSNNDNNNIVFTKILNCENVNVSNEQPKIIFRKNISDANYQNYDFIIGDGFLKSKSPIKSKKKKYPVYKNRTYTKKGGDTFRQSCNSLKRKNLFTKTISKNSFRPSINQKFYSTSDKVFNKKERNQKQKIKMENDKFINTVNKNYNIYDKKLLMSKLIQDCKKGFKKYNKQNEVKESFEQKNHKRKLDVLIKNGIKIDISTDNNENTVKSNENDNFGKTIDHLQKIKKKSKSCNKNDHRRNLNIFKVDKKENKNHIRPKVDQFEYISKIREQLVKIKSDKKDKIKK